jgi:hypothetical protein
MPIQPMTRRRVEVKCMAAIFFSRLTRIFQTS